VKTRFTKQFGRDLQRLRDRGTLARVRRVIEQIQQCQSLDEIAHLKKIAGYEGYYRIRVGDYRLGFKLQENEVVLMRILLRKDIYKYFP
jgi:mRNA interferase RelE/StbE